MAVDKYEVKFDGEAEWRQLPTLFFVTVSDDMQNQANVDTVTGGSTFTTVEGHQLRKIT